MKKLSLSILLSLAVLGLAGCPGNATNNANLRTNAVVSNGNMMSNSNTAIVVNSNANMTNLNGNMANTMSDTTTPSSFMTAAAYSNMAEIAAAKMTLTKTQNAGVKQFAQEMIADHTRANNELKQLAAKKDIVLPTEPDAEHQEMAADMSKLSGAEFDQEYIDGQVADHEKAVTLFQSEAENGTDAETKAFAAKTLPVLKMHLEAARKLDEKMK